MLKGECKNLFLKVRDFTDNLLAMQDFVELIQEFVRWNKGDAKIALINLNDYGFGTDEMIIAYDDMGGYPGGARILTPYQYVNLMIEVFDEYDDEEYFEDFWIPRLKEFVKTNEY